MHMRPGPDFSLLREPLPPAAGGGRPCLPHAQGAWCVPGNDLDWKTASDSRASVPSREANMRITRTGFEHFHPQPGHTACLTRLFSLPTNLD